MAAALRVFRAMSCTNPEHTTAHVAASARTSTKPITPLATETPKGRAMSTIRAEMAAVLAASATRRPSTMALRDTGAARSLSKYPPSISSTRKSAAAPNDDARSRALGTWKAA